ncbi:ABC transporter substrate-binding protein [Desulfovibrio sp. JC010]|uniref:substrate-binding periplasmic protein n=1 Tax=Desulfovibrio sp. JC010 TaxID=2593641 RepID=UPI0013D82757|nr:transporter substrate-binding domain-containing protein [Desulfovibrio sp. JC010]NDV28592.1 amino acid ABC transporter substrate-binding protein [Desulfovibrio sp. JC010]
MDQAVLRNLDKVHYCKPVRIKALKWKSIEDLKGKRIGGTAHTAYPLFEEAQKQGILTIDRGGNYDILLKKLRHNEIDAVPLIKAVCRYYQLTTMNKKERGQITYSPTVIESRRYYLILNKKLPENKTLIAKFNKGLRIIRENGTYDKIINDSIFTRDIILIPDNQADQ